MSALPFGKFKGQSLDQVPASYLGWLLGDWGDQPARVRRGLALDILMELHRRLEAIPECQAYFDELHHARPSVTVHQLDRHQLTPAQLRCFKQLIACGYKRLAGELHPDHGGNGEDMAVLNSLKSIVDRRLA